MSVYRVFGLDMSKPSSSVRSYVSNLPQGIYWVFVMHYGYVNIFKLTVPEPYSIGTTELINKMTDSLSKDWPTNRAGLAARWETSGTNYNMTGFQYDPLVGSPNPIECYGCTIVYAQFPKFSDKAIEESLRSITFTVGNGVNSSSTTQMLLRETSNSTYADYKGKFCFVQYYNYFSIIEAGNTIDTSVIWYSNCTANPKLLFPYYTAIGISIDGSTSARFYGAGITAFQ